MTDKYDNIRDFIRKYQTVYWCQYCGRYLPLTDGIYVHDDVDHPEDAVYGEGEHIHYSG